MKHIIVRIEPGTNKKIAIFFSRTIGRHRLYRRYLDNPGKGYTLFKYALKKRAQSLCDNVNKIHGGGYEVLEVDE